MNDLLKVWAYTVAVILLTMAVTGPQEVKLNEVARAVNSCSPFEGLLTVKTHPFDPYNLTGKCADGTKVTVPIYKK